MEPAGIQINGSNPWDITVHNEQLFSRISRDGTLGLGEAYMDGWWDCDAIDDLLSCFLAVKAGFSIANHLNPANLLYILQSKFTNMQSVRRAFQVGERH